MQNLADKWVKGCHWGHPGQHDPTYAGTGQNIASMYGKKPTYVELATLWYNEVVNYTYADNSCKHVCGHYKQVSCEKQKTKDTLEIRFEFMNESLIKNTFFVLCGTTYVIFEALYSLLCKDATLTNV